MQESNNIANAKAGDKVKCIDNRMVEDKFKLGDTYVLSYVHPDGEHGCFNHTGGRLWHLDRFELIKEKYMQKKFNPKSEPAKFVPPKPGDKIICINGKEFICCTLEFLNAQGLAKFYSSDRIFGFQPLKEYHHNLWQSWDEEGKVCRYSGFNIKEVIPQSKNKSPVALELDENPLYTVDEVFDGIYEVTKHLEIEIPWDYIDNVKEHLSRKMTLQYQEYLRLKAIYE